MPSKAQRASAQTKPQDAAISDVSQGILVTQAQSEDDRRAVGLDASAAEGAGDHDFSPEANAGQTGGESYDTYGAQAATAEHPNMLAGSGQTLVLGQAPIAPAVPMRGSRNHNEAFDPDIPNAINQSPRVLGVEKDPRNDPKHPDHAGADRKHPDFGKPAGQHLGRRTEAPDFVDLKAAKAGEATSSVSAVEPVT